MLGPELLGAGQVGSGGGGGVGRVGGRRMGGGETCPAHLFPFWTLLGVEL